MFIEGSEASYKGMCGTISHVGEKYIVLRLPPKPGLNAPLLLIYPQDYKKVSVMKDSQK